MFVSNIIIIEVKRDAERKRDRNNFSLVNL